VFFLFQFCDVPKLVIAHKEGLAKFGYKWGYGKFYKLKLSFHIVGY